MSDEPKFKNLHVLDGSVKITGFVDRNVAIVATTIENLFGFEASGPCSWATSGSSKRAPGDPVSPELGSLVATSRALRSLADEIDLEVAERMRLGEEQRADAEVKRRRRRQQSVEFLTRSLQNRFDPSLRARRIGDRVGAVTKPERDTD